MAIIMVRSVLIGIPKGIHVDYSTAIGVLPENYLLSKLSEQALTVANICSGDGTCICHNSVLPHLASFSSTLIWQHEQPSSKDWHIWLQALYLAFGPQLIIAIPLGGWL